MKIIKRPELKEKQIITVQAFSGSMLGIMFGILIKSGEYIDVFQERV